MFVERDILMLQRDHDVEVIHLSAGGARAEVSFPTTTAPMSTADPRSIRRARTLILERARHADIVHSMAASALLPFAGAKPSRPWVHTEHWSALLAPDTAPAIARAAIPLTRHLLKRPDVVIAVGNDLAAAIARVRAGRTVVIPNEVQRPVALRERPLAETTTLVGVGGLIRRKGPDLAVRVVAELTRRGEDVRLVWAGDGPLRAEAADLAAELGIQERVTLLGRVTPAEIGAVLAEADAFLLPTTMETFGVAIAEALVAGRPVVVSSTGEQASFVVEPDGVLVDTRTAEDYASAVQRLMQLNRDRTAAEIAARTRDLFAPDKRRAQTLAVYRDAEAMDTAALPQDVDVVIAAHDPRRDVARAVGSALSSRSVRAVHVVCHNMPASAIRAAAGDKAADARVNFIEHDDGISSPAGPFNRGLDQACGRYVAVLGSDDELTPGAIDAWRATAARSAADVVIAPLRHAGGAPVPTPPTWRARGLRGRRDRLAYRTAPLGLISTARFGQLRFTPGVATGEDLAFTTRIWFSDARICRHRGPGEYLIHDGQERVTFTPRPLAEELEALRLLMMSDFARGLAAGDRLALAMKMWRLPVFGAIHYRAGMWDAEDRGALRDLAAMLREYAPAAISVLSRADAALITAIFDLTVPDRELDRLSRARRRFGSLSALIPSSPVMLLAREAPLRFSAATWWTMRR